MPNDKRDFFHVFQFCDEPPRVAYMPDNDAIGIISGNASIHLTLTHAKAVAFAIESIIEDQERASFAGERWDPDDEPLTYADKHGGDTVGGAR